MRDSGGSSKLSEKSGQGERVGVGGSISADSQKSTPSQ